jgi:formate hydrogenlyase subunit 5
MPIEIQDLAREAEARWGGGIRPAVDGHDGPTCTIECTAGELPAICDWLFSERGYSFGGLIAERRDLWELRYVFYGGVGEGWVHVLSRMAGECSPSVSRLVHAADWHEREVEDLFGLRFEGHPRLGDFVLHNDVWAEDVAPMRKTFDGLSREATREPNPNWKPRRIVEETGAFAMPVGPIYSAATAPVHFQLETVGEDVIRALPRLFYAYRGLEKIAEGRPAQDAVLLAERISGTSAFAHSLGFCQAVERIWGIQAPERAAALRILLAEMERVRHHVAAIHGICESTGLAVAAAQAAILEERMLRISGWLTGHRYLFGMNVPGGLAVDLSDSGCARAAAEIAGVASDLAELQRMLSVSSSFLDRLEDVGNVPMNYARDFGLVGPIARASGLSRDLRKGQPYCGYERAGFEVPTESEGDGYARLRVLFREAEQSAGVISANARALAGGRFRVPEIALRAGAALGWVEAPGGAALHWVRLSNDGIVERYRIVTPSFANWHGFRLAAENFAFQDFPIILATFALSVHENDR